METSLRVLTDRVREGQWPLLPCANCRGLIAITAVQEIEAGDSRAMRGHDAWEPEWIHGRFVATPECACGAVVVVTGEYSVDAALTSGGTWYGEYCSYYEVRATSPGLRMVAVPDRAPKAVKKLTQEAAAVLWASPPAAASALRRAVEVMLDDLKVNKTTLSKARKRTRLTTHARIELLQASKPEVAEGLMAVKWVGNEGSHEAESMSIDQVLDIADVLGYALRLVYDDQDRLLKQKIARINRKRGSVQ